MHEDGEPWTKRYSSEMLKRKLEQYDVDGAFRGRVVHRLAS